MQYFPSPYELLAVAFFILALLVLFGYVIVSRLSKLERDLGDVRRIAILRRASRQRGNQGALAFVDDDGKEYPIEPSITQKQAVSRLNKIRRSS